MILNYANLLTTEDHACILQFHANNLPILSLNNLRFIETYFDAQDSPSDVGILEDFIDAMESMIQIDSDGLILQSGDVKIYLNPFFDLLQSVGGLDMAIKELREIREAMRDVLTADIVVEYKTLSTFLDAYILMFEDIRDNHAPEKS